MRTLTFSSVRNLAIGPVSVPSSPTRTQARPLAPCSTANSPSPSKNLRGWPGGVRHRQRADVLAGEGLELRALEDVGDVDELQLGAQVRLVVAVLQHRLAERDPREGRGDVAAAAELLEELGHQLLDRLEDVLLLDEAHLDVELVELARRAVGAGVLVAEAGRDLEVAVEARDHQQLLELLRGLRQRVELAGVQPGGDHEVAGALGGGRGQDRGRHLVEAERGHLVRGWRR